MAKPIRFMATMFFSIVLAVAGLLQPPTGSSHQSPQANTTSARNAALIAATSEVLKETSELRQLAILRPVQSSTQSRLEIEHMLIKNLDEETTPAQMHAAEVTLERLGLAPPDFHYRALMLRVLTEQVAGYYDPKSGEFHLADWIDLDGQRPVMAHELTHALQDQHFNLRRFERWPKGDSDAELATHSLIEGDAMLAMSIYVANNPLRALAFLKSLGTTGMSSQELDKAPRALREQILHPEKYFDHEAPVKVRLSDMTGLLNNLTHEAAMSAPSASTGGSSAQATWKRLDYDVEGEWGFYLILDEFLKSPTESHRAAAGWGGDRFAVYEGPTGEVLFVSLSTWDTENDAREFFDAYVKRTGLRYPTATQADDPQTPSLEIETGNRKLFRTSAGTVSIELRGARVVVVEGLPDYLASKDLLRAVWQSGESGRKLPQLNPL